MRIAFRKKNYYETTYSLQLFIILNMMFLCTEALEAGSSIIWWLVGICGVVLLLTSIYKYVVKKRTYQFLNISSNDKHEAKIKEIIEDISERDLVKQGQILVIDKVDSYKIQFYNCPYLLTRKTVGRINEFIKINGKTDMMAIFLAVVSVLGFVGYLAKVIVWKGIMR